MASDSFSIQKTALAPCPSSPNCVSTQEQRKRKRMRPIPFDENMMYAKRRLKIILSKDFGKFNATLIKEEDHYLHYEFKTKIGKFIDDVEFVFDEKTKQIHFRSASQKGWSDMGKNKRRMKKVRRKFKNAKIYF